MPVFAEKRAGNWLMSFFMLASISAWVSLPDTMPFCRDSLRLGYEILLDTWASDSGLSGDTASAAP